jgi:dienelactone hydrolase
MNSVSFKPLVALIQLARLTVVALFIACWSGGAYAQTFPLDFEAVEFPSDQADGLKLRGYLSRVPNLNSTNTKEPLVVALHGCGGLWDARGDLEPRYREYQAWFKARGVNMLLVDSFSARGKARGICTEPLADRAVRPADRRLDVQGAMRWLEAQSWVDTQRLVLLGWSHGGSTVLSTLDRFGSPDSASTAASTAISSTTAWPRDLPDFKAAIAFYPGCTPASQNQAYRLDAPLLLMIGEDDDWTPAAACERFHRNQTARLSQRGLESERFQLKLYPGAHHAFDSGTPVRRRPDVPNGTNRGQGVTAGGHPPSREDALIALDAFLKRYL